MQLELPVAQAVLAEAVAGAVEGGAVVVADGDLPAAGVAVLRAVVERQVVLPVALPIAHLDVLEGGDRVGAAALAVLGHSTSSCARQRREQQHERCPRQSEPEDSRGHAEHREAVGRGDVTGADGRMDDRAEERETRHELRCSDDSMELDQFVRDVDVAESFREGAMRN